METNSEFGKDQYRLEGDEEGIKGKRYHSPGNKPIIGVVLVLAGLFLVIRNTGFFPDFIDDVIFSWPMLLIAIGLVMTLSSSEKTAGVIVLAVGGFFMIPQVFRETFHMYNMFWPSIFIIVGVIFIVSHRRGWGPTARRKDAAGDDYIDFVNIFGGGDRQIVSQNFQGGKVTAIFGGGEIDMTKAGLAAGVSELEVACVFGGVTLIVPEDWWVSIEVTPILGGFSDSRKLTPGRAVDSSKHLVVKGVVIFGGGEVKSY